MSFADAREGPTLLKKTLVGILDFSGRSRRTEVFYWYIFAYFFHFVALTPFFAMASYDALVVASSAIGALLVVPAIALFVRRLHDQDRSGWFVLLFAALILWTVLNEISELTLFPHATSSRDLLGWLQGLTWIAVAFLLLVPGTNGPNRFGDDPRF